MTSEVRFVLVETTANRQHFVALDLVHVIAHAHIPPERGFGIEPSHYRPHQYLAWYLQLFANQNTSRSHNQGPPNTTDAGASTVPVLLHVSRIHNAN